MKTLRDGAVRSRWTLLAEQRAAGMSDYLDRATTHDDTAREMTTTRTTTTLVDGVPGVVVEYENPAALRLIAHEHELAQECWTLAQDCARDRGRALMRQYQHRCYVAARLTTPTLAGDAALRSRDALNLVRDVAARHEQRQRHGPTQPVTVRPLATCAASNAPGWSFPACAYARDLRRTCAASNDTGDTTG